MADVRHAKRNNENRATLSVNKLLTIAYWFDQILNVSSMSSLDRLSLGI